jgi:hypothetical protein
MQDGSQAMGAYRLLGAFAPQKSFVEVASSLFFCHQKKNKCWLSVLWAR